MNPQQHFAKTADTTPVGSPEPGLSASLTTDARLTEHPGSTLPEAGAAQAVTAASDAAPALPTDDLAEARYLAGLLDEVERIMFEPRNVVPLRESRS